MNTLVIPVHKRAFGRFSLKTLMGRHRLRVYYRTNWTREPLVIKEIFMHESLRPLLIKVYHSLQSQALHPL